MCATAGRATSRGATTTAMRNTAAGNAAPRYTAATRMTSVPNAGNGYATRQTTRLPAAQRAAAGAGAIVDLYKGANPFLMPARALPAMHHPAIGAVFAVEPEIALKPAP